MSKQKIGLWREIYSNTTKQRVVRNDVITTVTSHNFLFAVQFIKYEFRIQLHIAISSSN